MRKLFALMTLLVAVFASSCEKPAPEPTAKVTFEFSALTATHNSSSVTVTPSDLAANYFAVNVETERIAGLTDSEIMNLDFESLTSYKGVQTLSFKGLKEDTAYTIIAFAMGDSAVSRQPYRTQVKSEPKPGEFEVEISIANLSASTVTATATPSDDTTNYFFRVITKIELDAFGIYNNDLEIFNYIIENPNSNDYIFTGEKVLEYTNLAAETDYIAVAFNVDTYEQVVEGSIDVELFRYEFRTHDAPEVDPSSLFTYSDLQVSHTGFTLNVTPVKGEDSFWGYYIWTKKSFYETLEQEARVNIVMRSYFGLNNLGVEQGYDFGTFMQEYMGQTGTSEILNYEQLKPGNEYVVVLFYLDPEVKDPTEVYDYNFVSVEFKTLDPSADGAASLLVSEPIVEKDGFKYNVKFVVKTDEKAVDLLVGAQMWANYDFEKYWDPNDWSQIQAFFMFRKPVSDETLAQAKTEEGAVVSFTGIDADEYAFFFEVLNAENTATQYAVHVERHLFE